VGISSITPTSEWLAVRADFWNCSQRRKSSRMKPAISDIMVAAPRRLTSS